MKLTINKIFLSLSIVLSLLVADSARAQCSASNLAVNQGNNVFGHLNSGQVFTAPCAGSITAISLAFNALPSGVGDMTLSIRDGNLPTSPVIYSQLFPYSSISIGVNTFTLSTPVPILNGEANSFEISDPTGVSWNFGAYPDGDAYFSSNIFAGLDLTFSVQIGTACTAPSFLTCPTDITVNNVPNNCGRVVNYTLPTFDAGDCGGAVMTQIDGSGLTAGDLFPVGTTTQTYQVVDGNLNSVTCTFDVIVVDNQNPTITPLTFSNVTVNNSPGICGANVPWLEPTASDNCPTVALTASSTMGSYFPIGTTVVTYTATDASLNTSSLSFNVNVIDNELPVITCPADLAVNTDAGQCFATVALGTAIATDNCAIVSLTNDAPPTFAVGTTTVIWTAVDNQGNIVTCNQLVTVTDNELPIALCQNISIDLDAAGDVSIVAADIDNLSSDPCGIILSASQTNFTCANEGANNVVLTVTDVNGNVASCTSIVTVNDITLPVATCQDVTVQLDMSGNVMLNTNQVNNGSSDACGIASMSLDINSFTCANVGLNPVVLTVTDVNGLSATCSANITVQDLVLPTALCQDITVPLDVFGNALITAANVNNGSNDACGILSTSIDIPSFNCSNIGANTVTLTVIDNNSNSSTCSSVVTIVDDIAPAVVCQDVTVFLDATGNGSTTAALVDNGSSDACGIASMALSQSAFTCAEVGTKTVILTVTDVNGNENMCSSTVTIVDNVAPVAVCQDITVQLDAAGNASITGVMVNNGSTDICGIASYSVAPNTFNCTNIGANPVVLTVTDVNGNSSTCAATVTVEDSVDPIAVCQNTTVLLDGTGNASIVASDIDGGSSDACGIASLSASQTAFTCANIGANNVVLTVTDVNGNTATCTAIVTVLETTAPIAVCQDLTLNLDATGNVSIAAAALDNGSSDNCGTVSFAASQTTFDCSDLGANIVTLTVTDGSGNSATCTSNVTIVDNIAPIANCQNISINLNAAGTVSITPAMINNGSSDNCTITSITASQTVFTCANVGANNVTLTLTDQSGNVSTCVAIVTVVDNISPTALCQNATANLDATGNAAIVVADVNSGSFDNCAILSTVLSTSAFTCANVGPNPVTLTVTDVNGNVASCLSTVTVIDAIDPTMICQDITINLNVAGTASIVAADINSGSFDNCGIASLGASQVTFNCSNVGANSVILTATDVNGNTNTCASTVTVIDAVAPAAICQNISVNLNAAGTASITGAMINNGSSDACGISSLTASPSAFTCANVGPNAVTLTVLDVNGNSSTCTATVTVVDNIAPTAICQNISVNLDAVGAASIVAADINNGSFDNCGIASLLASTTAFSCANVGANNVTLTVTDVNSNSSTCTAVVTVIDNIAPTAICQNSTVNLSAAGTASITGAMINNGSSDNCSIASLSVVPSAFTCANVGGNTVTLTVLDVNGLSSTCTATVTVVDNIAPTALCQNQTINLDASGVATTTALAINNGSFDNCGIATIAASQTSFTCANVGANTVTLTVTDVNSNVSTCTSTITVVDNLAPIAVCQNITVNLDALGAATITAAMVDNGSSDNCAILSTTISNSAFTCANVGANNVTLTVTDVNSNSSTCAATVTVIDNTAPTAICQAIAIDLNAAGTASITPAMINNGSFDNCGISSLSASQTTFNCANVGANTVTLTVMDVNLNSSTCTSVVTVSDVTTPIAICQNVTVNLDALGAASVTAAMIDNASSDACGIASLALSQTAFDCTNVGANPVTLTATDVNGNSSTCASTVTVVDNMAPIALCNSIVVNLDATGNATITAAMIDNASNDNCGIASTSISNTSFTCANVGANTVTLLVTDVNGNSAACNATVTIADVTSPIALCQNQTLSLDIFGNASTTIGMLNNGSTDECGIASITASQLAFDCSDLGANSIVVTVLDINGNSSTCTSTVTVQDLMAPIVTTQNITVPLDATGNATITGAMVIAAAFDNCAISSSVLPVSTFSCSDIGPNTVTVTVTDASGNSASATAIVTIIDNMAPTAICQNVTIALDAAGNASITAGMIDNGSIDNCAIATITASQTAFDCSDLGNNNVILTVTDVNGNSSSCLAVVTVEDNSIPTAICQNVNLNLDSNGDALLTPAMVNNGSTDNCTIAFMEVSQAAFDCSNTGANTVTFTVTDQSGNASTCTAIVTIVDNTNPNALCQNISINLDALGAASITPAMIDIMSNDNCGVASLAVSNSTFDCTNVGANTITLTVTDPSGNSSTCNSVVTVSDVTAPAALCQNVTVNLDAMGLASVTPAMIDNGSADACGIASMTLSQSSFDCSNVGANLVTLSMVDVNGNSASCTSTVTVVDNIIPSALCQNVSVILNPAGAAAITTGMINNGSSDICGIASIAASQLVFDCSDLGANNITLSVTDVNANVGTCIAVVTVIDNIVPTISCPAAITVNATVGTCGAAIVLATPTSADNCSTTISNNAPAIFPLGTTTVTWTAVDPAGNSVSCTQLVTVIDVENPTIVCPSNVNVNTDLNICFATGVNLGTPVTTDNCTVALVTNNAPSVFPTGVTVVTWTVMDQSGNSATCTQTVTVVDNQAPTVLCPQDIVQTSTQGSCGSMVTYSTPQVIDNCLVATMTQSDNSGYTSGNVFPVGTTVISYTATDLGGNVYTCSFNVTIIDDQHPIIHGCPSDILVASGDVCDVAVNWVAPTAIDNCPGVQFTTTNAPGSLFGPGTTIVSYTATDNSGNSTVCSFNVTVVDGNAPVVPVMADVYNSCEVTALPSPIANDICSGEISGTTNIVFPITTIGVTAVVWSFNDGNGNVSTATQYVYIDGEVDASVSPVNETTLMANNANATYQWIDCATGSNIPGATSQTFTATMNGNYAVVVTEGNCPSETSTCYPINSVGLEDVTALDLVIYPNPSVGGEFTIQYEGSIDKVEIVDMIGRIIAVETNLVNGKVNGSELASGKYFVNVYTEGLVIVKEVIVVSK
ncbi:MAG: HYR domain-containing protein [Bacteroidota bacterium]